MGAWIEIVVNDEGTVLGTVAPLVGAWIEIRTTLSRRQLSRVAPLVGAWIEINPEETGDLSGCGRSPRGSVD